MCVQLILADELLKHNRPKELFCPILELTIIPDHPGEHDII